MLIDKSYFFGEINIAGLGNIPVQNTLALFIGKREPEYLELVLGYAFNALFTAAMAVDPIVTRWSDLLNGAEYKNCKGFTKKWKGFKNTDKQSPIANYIFHWYDRDNVTFPTTTGEKEGKSDNAKSASSNAKMVRAWNEMIDQTALLHDFLLNKKDVSGTLIYPEFNVKEIECNKLCKMNLFGI